MGAGAGAAAAVVVAVTPDEEEHPVVNFSLSEATKRILDAHARRGRAGARGDAAKLSVSGEIGGGSGQMVWLKGGSVYEVVGLYKMVRDFCDEGTGLVIVSRAFSLQDMYDSMRQASSRGMHREEDACLNEGREFMPG